MLRAICIAWLSLLTAGCWVSDRDLFDTGELAQLDLTSAYTVTNQDRASGWATVTVRPDRLVSIESRVRMDQISGPDDDEGETAPMTTQWGFVRIPETTGNYYLVFGVTDEDDDEVEYYLAVENDRGFWFYVPNCAGTVPGTEGMEVDGSASCRFTSKQALFDAARRAINFIEADHIVMVAPSFTMMPNPDRDRPRQGG